MRATGEMRESVDGSQLDSGDDQFVARKCRRWMTVPVLDCVPVSVSTGELSSRLWVQLCLFSLHDEWWWLQLLQLKVAKPRARLRRVSSVHLLVVSSRWWTSSWKRGEWNTAVTCGWCSGARASVERAVTECGRVCSLAVAVRRWQWH